MFPFDALSATLELESAETLLNGSTLWQESRSSNSNIGALPAQQQPFDSVSSVLFCSERLGTRSQQELRIFISVLVGDQSVSFGTGGESTIVELEEHESCRLSG